jgi:hypothetical protein
MHCVKGLIVLCVLLITFYALRFCMNISVHIERLILDGVPVSHGQRPLLQAAVEAELTRLLAAYGLAPGLLPGRAVPYTPAEDIQLAREGDPTRLGEQIARAVYGGFSR